MVAEAWGGKRQGTRLYTQIGPHKRGWESDRDTKRANIMQKRPVVTKMWGGVQKITSRRGGDLASKRMPGRQCR